MKNVVLLHGRWPERIDGALIADIPLCDPNNEGNWMGWTKKYLEESGYSVICPIIADAWKASYEEWKEELDRLDINEDTVLVGLSSGGYAWLRWLGESGKKVKKLILVAPASRLGLADTDREKLPLEDEFYSYEVGSSLKSQIQEQVVIFVSNDSPSILASVDLYERVLSAKVVRLEGQGHFSFLIPELPELLKEIQSRPKVVLFDFDGVIADTFGFCFRIIQARDQVTEEEYRARFEGNINDAPKKVDRTGVQSKPFDFYGQYTPALMACEPNQEVVNGIRALVQDHLLIIISSTNSQPIRAFLAAHGLEDYFKEILGNDVEKSKVKKIQAVLQRYGLKPVDTVLITDTLGDIKEAKECGVRSIAVTWGYHSATTLAKGNPYKIVDHPSEITDIVRSMETEQ